MADCSFNDCEEEATTSVSLSHSSETCPTCGNVKSVFMKFPMCEAHGDEFAASGSSSTLLLINATGELV